MKNEIPYGFCLCGCGKKTKVSPKTCTSKGWVKGQPRKYLLGHHVGTGKNHPRWKPDGCLVQSRGKVYRQISINNHPRNKRGRVFEHILVAEKAMGKYLPKGAVVHHIDENGLNNAPGNLVVCQDDSYHKLIHKRARALNVSREVV